MEGASDFPDRDASVFEFQGVEWRVKGVGCRVQSEHKWIYRVDHTLYLYRTLSLAVNLSHTQLVKTLPSPPQHPRGRERDAD